MTLENAGPGSPDDWGILATWIDADNRPQRVSEASVRRLRSVLGRPPDDRAAAAPLVRRPGTNLGLGAVDVELEGGGRRRVDGALPADFPFGYHALLQPSERPRALIVSPGRCYVPSRRWGWAVQLHAVRSHGSWGIGDFADLSELRKWAQSCGAGFLLTSPLHAAAPSAPREPSPYLPVTRRHHDPIYLCVHQVAGADSVDLRDLQVAAAALNGV